MEKNIDINITDLSGHTFTIKLNLDIGAMKNSISNYYDNKFKDEFLLENNLTYYDLLKDFHKYFISDYYKKGYDYSPDNIQLIYKGEILEQFDIETYKYLEDDFKDDNKMNIIIIKNNEYDDDNDNWK